MNAFHPKFMATFYPNFWRNAAVDAHKSQMMTDIVANTRKINPSHGTLLSPRVFHIYSRA